MNSVLPATEPLMERFYSSRANRPAMTTRSVVALKNGQPVGVAGGYVEPEMGGTVLYGDLTDDLRRDKRLLLSFTRAALEVARSFGLAVYSLADPAVEGSEILLKHLGGKEIGGRIYEFEGRG